jgi:hypothetical protein
MNLSFEHTEVESKGEFTINKISNDLDLTQAFPAAHGRQKDNNQKQKQKQKRRQKQLIPVCPNENKMNYGSPKQPSRKFYDKNQVRQVVSNTVPPKMTNDSIEERKVLGFKGPTIICFFSKCK